MLVITIEHLRWFKNEVLQAMKDKPLKERAMFHLAGLTMIVVVFDLIWFCYMRCFV